MGFTDVTWETRSAERLARDLTDGAGPASVGQAGAAWVRVANELASVSEEYDKTVENITAAFASQGADAAVRKLQEFGRWIQATSLSAAGNGERAEQAAIANGVAVVAMPSVSEATAARMSGEVMDSLAAYNGAILVGHFAELDEVASSAQASASAVMYQYEQSCAAMANPWQQPQPPDVNNGSALAAETAAKVEQKAAADRGGAARIAGAGAVPPPLARFQAAGVTSSGESKKLQTVSAGVSPSGGGGLGGMGGGYGPMAAMGRGGLTREYESSMPTAALDGGGEPGAGVSQAGTSWLPAAEPNDAEFKVSSLSWGPDTAVFDELAVPDEPPEPVFAEEAESNLEQASNRWLAGPVIGADERLTL